MEIQNISGADAVPSGFSATSEIPHESEYSNQSTRTEETPPPEENRGRYIDTYA